MSWRIERCGFARISNLKFPSTAHFIGPLIARLNMPLPDEILNLPRDLRIVYFAIGSSSWPEIVARIIAGFAGKLYRVIAPVKYQLDKQPVQIPDNVLVTDWLPALEVNRLADMAVTHGGGHGTVMNACLSGKPVVSVAISLEQFLNLECLMAKDFAISRCSLIPDRLCDSIEKLRADKTAQDKAREYQKVIEGWDNPQHIRSFFCETVG